MKRSSFLVVALFIVPALLFVGVAIRRSTIHQDTRIPPWLEKLKSAQDLENLAISQSLGGGDVPMLRKALKSPRRAERLKAAWVLGKISAPAKSSEADLILAIGDEEIGVQVAAMQALTSIGTANETLIPTLVPKLGVNHAGVGFSAAELIDKIEQKRKAQNLTVGVMDEYGLAMKFVRSPIPSVRVKGAYRLASLSPKNKQAQSSLEFLLNDPDDWVRERAEVFVKYPSSIQPERMNTAYSP